MNTPLVQKNTAIDGLRVHLNLAYEAAIEKARNRYGFIDGVYACWLIRAGSVQIRIGKEVLVGLPGTWVFIPAWCMRTQSFSPDARILSIRFTCQDEVHAGSPFSTGLPRVFPAAQAPELQPLAEDLVAMTGQVRTATGDALTMARFSQEAAFLHFFTAWYRQCLQLGGQRQAPAGVDHRLMQARRILESHGRIRPVPYAELSTALGLSRVHIDRLFHRALGCSPATWLDLLVVDRAEQALADERRSQRSIAQDLHFTDETHFVRWYKRQTGRTPGQQRQR